VAIARQVRKSEETASGRSSGPLQRGDEPCPTPLTPDHDPQVASMNAPLPALQGTCIAIACGRK
jgi:hypothetical protein